MKKYIIILMVVVLTSCADKKNLVKETSLYNEEAYIAALRSDKDGLVQSAIFQLVYQQMNGYNRLSSNILSEFESIKNNSNSKNIRKISGIAIEFAKEFDYERQIELKVRFIDQERFFELISDLLQEKHKKLNIDSFVKE